MRTTVVFNFHFVWAMCGLVLAGLAWIGARRHVRFSLTALLAAVLCAALVLGPVFSLCPGGQARSATDLLALGIGAVFYSAAGLLAAAFVRRNLVLTGRKAEVLAWVAGMTYAWAVAVMLLIWQATLVVR